MHEVFFAEASAADPSRPSSSASETPHDLHNHHFNTELLVYNAEFLVF